MTTATITWQDENGETQTATYENVGVSIDLDFKGESMKRGETFPASSGIKVISWLIEPDGRGTE